MDQQEIRRQEVLARLDRVTDPELDESVTALGFIKDIAIDAAGEVEISFRLPTYWCSANFAYLMADDMRSAVSTLPWVNAVRPLLLEHMYAEAINAGVARGASFKEVFGAEITDDLLEGLRLKFLRKAFQRRQEVVLRALLEAGWTPDAVVGLNLGELGVLVLQAPEWPALRLRYVDMRTRLATTPLGVDDPAFLTLEGAQLVPERLVAHLQALRTVRLNMEFNGAICRGLLAAREARAEQPTIPAARAPTPT